jgi:hypothetical protein
MPLEGEIVVALDWDGRRVRAVDVRSSRPLAASRILIGKTAADAAATVPMLFGICGGAQGAASAAALAAAGAAGFDADDPARLDGVVVEALQAAFWHLLIDWPNTMGTATEITPVTAVRHLIATSARTTDGRALLGDRDAMRTLAQRVETLALRAIFGMPSAHWRALADVDALRAWAATGQTVPAQLLAQVLAQAPRLGHSDVAPMPCPTRAALLDVVAPAFASGIGFVRVPTWSGVPVETGALARMQHEPLVAACLAQFGNGAATRVVARLTEIAALLSELDVPDARGDLPPRVQGVALAANVGLSAVETGRGLLLHRARVHDECVVDYEIVAPTEWNFHPEGALARGLAGMEAADSALLLRAARLCVHTLDPCVASRVEVGHA